MKISWNWLRDFVELPPGIGPSEVAARLSVSGVAVDGLTEIGKGLSGAIVAEVRGKRPHPKADKLTLVDVFDGNEVTQVVCGAPNVPAPGEPGASPRVVWARPGATLPSGITLSVREVRGVPSPGMLCAEDELGLSEDHGGILLLSPGDGLEIGSDFAKGVGLPDWIFDLDVTPNRPDLLGHVGVAREVAALFQSQGARFRPPHTDLTPWLDSADASSLAAVEVRDPSACPRYLAHVLRGVRVGPSPLWARLRLQRLGVRAISNVVDATNLALLEWGHPLHAFDLAALKDHKIVVRRAAPGEKLTTLDNVERELLHDDLLIADAEHGAAVAGVMGGAKSEVRAGTQELLLEAAYFRPDLVRRTARRLRLHTEASHRFERGTDPNDTLTAAARRCAQLIVELAGGRIARGAIDVYPFAIPRPSLTLRPARTDAILGMEIKPTTQAQHLRALGLEVLVSADATSLAVQVPTFRPDLTREIDLIEEVMRLHGLGELPTTLPRLHVAPPPESTPGQRVHQRAEKARDVCTALGLDEVQLFSMLGPERLQLVGGPAALEPIRIDNPLREELSAMRTQLLPGLLDALRLNLSHGMVDVGLFEVGEIFLTPPAEGQLPDERARVAGVLTGHRPHFLKPVAADRLDIHDLRGLVEQLLASLGFTLRFSAPEANAERAPALASDVFVRAAAGDEAPWLHPGVAAVIARCADGAVVGSFGEVHPDLRRKLDLDPAVFAFELELLDLPEAPRLFQAPSRFPAVARDLSFFIGAEVPAASLIAALLDGGEPLLCDVQLLEDYREPGKVPAGQKGMLFNLTYRSDERTLVDVEVSAAHERLVARLQGRFPVQLRQ
ncbi:MAG: phenylalanine--tRNA ligase subunit beta [Polyangia bacterium]